MSFVISPAIPFPNIYWFLQVMRAGAVQWEANEHFTKLSYRNRYYIATAAGQLALSIPLAEGREQRTSMQDVRISYAQKWQQQHWRTLIAAYARSPYFSHYEPLLLPLFTMHYERLFDFNLASVHWLKAQLGISFTEAITESYVKVYDERGATDLRAIRPSSSLFDEHRHYTQVFGDRTGFLPNLSVLDLLFAEGPHAKSWLAGHL